MIEAPENAEKPRARYHYGLGCWLESREGSHSRLLECGICRGPHFRSRGKNVCLPCQREAARQRRINIREATIAAGIISPAVRINPRSYKEAQRRAIGAVHTAIAKGQLPRLTKESGITCIDCDRPAAVYEHRDYAKPLEVDPVCHHCNVLRGPALWAIPA